jgi:hypothetical protein
MSSAVLRSRFSDGGFIIIVGQLIFRFLTRG